MGLSFLCVARSLALPSLPTQPHHCQHGTWLLRSRAGRTQAAPVFLLSAVCSLKSSDSGGRETLWGDKGTWPAMGQADLAVGLRQPHLWCEWHIVGLHQPYLWCEWHTEWLCQLHLWCVTYCRTLPTSSMKCEWDIELYQP